MIRNFEKYTHEMTWEENHVVMPWLVRILTLCIGKDKAITNKKIVQDFNAKGMTLLTSDDPEHSKYVKTEAARIRKLIHILRVSDAIPFLLASTKGYYISDDRDEIENYIGSVEDRLRAVHKIRHALKRQLNVVIENEYGIQTKLVIE